MLTSSFKDEVWFNWFNFKLNQSYSLSNRILDFFAKNKNEMWVVGCPMPFLSFFFIFFFSPEAFLILPLINHNTSCISILLIFKLNTGVNLSSQHSCEVNNKIRYRKQSVFPRARSWVIWCGWGWTVGVPVFQHYIHFPQPGILPTSRGVASWAQLQQRQLNIIS